MKKSSKQQTSIDRGLSRISVKAHHSALTSASLLATFQLSTDSKHAGVNMLWKVSSVSGKKAQITLILSCHDRSIGHAATSANACAADVRKQVVRLFKRRLKVLKAEKNKVEYDALYEQVKGYLDVGR